MDFRRTCYMQEFQGGVAQLHESISHYFFYMRFDIKARDDNIPHGMEANGRL